MAIDIDAAHELLGQLSGTTSDLLKVTSKIRLQVGGIDALTPAAKAELQANGTVLRDKLQTQATDIVANLTP